MLTELRILYIDFDANQEVGFGAYAYHVKEQEPDQLPKQIIKQPILFLSKTLARAELRYWPIEVEVAALVWVVKKIRHLIEASELHIVVYVDQQAILDIAKPEQPKHHFCRTFKMPYVYDVVAEKKAKHLLSTYTARFRAPRDLPARLRSARGYS